MKARSRKSDQQPSKDAAKRMSHHITKQAAEVLSLIGRAKGGYTAQQLESCEKNKEFDALGWTPKLDRYQISRRLPDLCAAGKVKRVGVGICPIRGVSMTFWTRA